MDTFLEVSKSLMKIVFITKNTTERLFLKLTSNGDVSVKVVWFCLKLQHKFSSLELLKDNSCVIR